MKTRTPMTWREHVHHCDAQAAAHRRRIEQMVQHGVFYLAALALIAWEVAQKIT